jgi:hypothetical protein
MRLLTLPVTIARVPIELGFGAAKQAVKFAHGLVGGGGEEPVAEEPRPAPPPRRRRTSSRAGARSGNGRARSGAGSKRASRRTAAPSGRTAKSGSRTAEPSRATAEPGRPAEAAMKAAPPVDEPAGAGAVAPSTVTPAAAEPAEPSPAHDPVHVGEESELVAEAAETGAEDGAGAEVAVDEPWPGYDEMTAADIEDRLLTEGSETAAAVSLYEASHKGRASILEAASRTMTA